VTAHWESVQALTPDATQMANWTPTEVPTALLTRPLLLSSEHRQKRLILFLDRGTLHIYMFNTVCRLQVDSSLWREARAHALQGEIAPLRMLSLNVQMAPKDGRARFKPPLCRPKQNLPCIHVS
jgi:hypothetical protein